MKAQYLYVAIVFFSFVILLLIISMLLIVLNKKWMLVKKTRIAGQLEEWLMDIILENTQADNQPFLIPKDIELLLQSNLAREVLIEELMKVKKSLSGISGENLEKLYTQLRLYEISLKRMSGKLWHVKVKGIQELAIMNQHTYDANILELTNDKDNIVRMEAQTAMVRLQGYQGLRFFDNLSYPLSEWHQVNLLMLFAHEPIREDGGIYNWLKSPNVSVVQFSLKLIAEQHAEGFHEEVVKCLHHPDAVVRKEAILCLGEMPSVGAAAELLARFRDEPEKNNRIDIIREFGKTGSEQDIPFLQTLQQDEDVDIKLAADKAVLYLQKR